MWLSSPRENRRQIILAGRTNSLNLSAPSRDQPREGLTAPFFGRRSRPPIPRADRKWPARHPPGGFFLLLRGRGAIMPMFLMYDSRGRHGRACPGLSRPSMSLFRQAKKTWMPATSAGMTSKTSRSLVLPSFELVRAGGFEPPVSCFQGRWGTASLPYTLMN